MIVTSGLAELANALKTKKFAALVLLDPFGMQINWSSIADFKGTRSDIGILVPTGVIINRLLYQSGKLEHVEKLEAFFGLSVDEIKKEFYKKEMAPTLFGEEEETQIQWCHSPLAGQKSQRQRSHQDQIQIAGQNIPD